MPESSPIESPSASPDLLAEIAGVRQAADLLTRETTEAAEEHRRSLESRMTEESERNQSEVARITEARSNDLAEAQARHQDATNAATGTWRSTRSELEDQAEEMRVRIRRRFVNNKEAAKTALEEATWLAETVYEANETKPREDLEKLRTEIGNTLADFDELDARMIRETRRYRQPRPRAIELDHQDLCLCFQKMTITLGLSIFQPMLFGSNIRSYIDIYGT